MIRFDSIEIIAQLFINCELYKILLKIFRTNELSKWNRLIKSIKKYIILMILWIVILIPIT